MPHYHPIRFCQEYPNKVYGSEIQQSISRAKQASLSILRITDENLRSHLDQLLSEPAGEKNSLLADPLFEQTFGWKQSKEQMIDLAEDLLNDKLLEALDKKKNGRYRFGLDWYPYTHQLKSWQTLLADKEKSIVVTSGTGSGKTECFMLPILHDLIQEQQLKKSKPLVGVRALFLYPLNALINSQQERLDKWTQHFENKIRFCLYNGNTEEHKSKVRADQNKRPNEILSRELLRQEPPPILVTNGTMLEYMLVRQIDSPILTISREQQSLRWIVLDEAHTYIGSQAAELSLLLRRVLQAFGVKAKNVRFIATSATIAGKESTDKLQYYLASLAGIEINQVVVIDGQRETPKLPYVKIRNQSFSSIQQIDASNLVSQQRFNALCASPIAKELRQIIVNHNQPSLLEQLVTKVTVEPRVFTLCGFT